MRLGNTAPIDGQSLLQTLANLPAGAADERAVADALRGLPGVADDVWTDAVGNVVLHRAGSGPKVMLMAHMDEISLLVRDVDDQGLIWLVQAGGFDQRTLVGQEVVVRGRETLPGVIGSVPPHLTSAAQRNESVPLDALFVDVGMPTARTRELVAVGDRVTLRRPVVPLLGSRMAGKGLDDRAGVTAMVLCMEALGTLEVTADVYAVATVQEEVGSPGAVVAATALHPDIAVALDVCHGDIPGVPPHLGLPLGAGPALGLGPHVHPKVFARLRDVATEGGLPFQVEASPGATDTDADPVAIANDGVATGLVSIPLRYMHTATEVLDYADLAAAAGILARFVASIDAMFLEDLACY